MSTLLNTGLGFLEGFGNTIIAVLGNLAVRRSLATVLFGLGFIALTVGGFGACALWVIDTVIDPAGRSGQAWLDAFEWLGASALMLVAAFALWRRRG